MAAVADQAKSANRVLGAPSAALAPAARGAQERGQGSRGARAQGPLVALTRPTMLIPIVHEEVGGMEEHDRFPRSILGREFPKGFVGGMVEDRSALPRVLGGLGEAGVREGEVRVLPGERALEVDASSIAMRATVARPPGEAAASAVFLAGALLGDVLIGVEAASEDRARAVARVLLEEGVSLIHHFGPASVRPLEEPAGSAV